MPDLGAVRGRYPFDYIIYRVSSSVYKVLDCIRNRNIYTGSTVLPAFQTARDKMANISTPLSTGTYGGTTFVDKGIYTFTDVEANNAMFDIDDPSGGSLLSAQRFIGDGFSTVLSFQPTSAVDTGIRLKGYYNRLSNFWIRGNSDISNLVNIIPAAWNGTLYDIKFDGYRTTYEYCPNTNAIRVGGNTTSLSAYNWEIRKIGINNFRTGILLDYDATYPQAANNNYVCDINATTCDYAIDCKAISNVIHGIRHQGNTITHVGIAAVRLNTTAGHNTVSQVVPELFTSDINTNRSLDCAAVILEDGSYLNEVSGVSNSGGTRIIDQNVNADGFGSTNIIHSNIKDTTLATETVGSSPAIIVNTGANIRRYFVYDGIVTKVEIGRGSTTTNTYNDTKVLPPYIYEIMPKDALKITYINAPTVKSLYQ